MNHLIFFGLLLFLGCASQIKKDQAEIRSFYSQKKYRDSLKTLNKSKVFKDKKSKLLELLERGRLYIALNDDFKASKVFEEAIQLSDQLYSKSLSVEIRSTLTKRYENYFGEYFERSMIYYYQTLSYLKLSQVDCFNIKKKKICQSEQEKNEYKVKARATLLLWDSTLQAMAREENYDTLFIKDIWNRIFAGLIHEFIGESQDLTIALNLFKEARDTIQKVGLTYKVYNNKYSSLAEEIRKNSYLPDKVNWKSFSETNENFSSIQQFLELKICNLLKRKNQFFPAELSRLGISQEAIKNSSKEESNVLLILEEGLISPKIVKDVTYNLRTAIDEMEDGHSKALIRGIGMPILTYFALGPLGLGYYDQSGNTHVYVHHNAGSALMEEVGIEYSIATIDPPNKVHELKIELINADKKSEFVLPIAGSLSDLAYQNLVEKNSKEGLKNGSRIAIKYALAILAAYSTYKSLKGNDGSNELWAKTAAIAQYVASTKMIKNSESPDERYWSTLPAFIRTQSLYLEPGEYKILIKKADKNDQKKKKVKPLINFKFQIAKGKRYIFPLIIPQI